MIQPNQHLLSEPDLMNWLGCKRRAALEKYLREHGVRVIYGPGGRICTTLEAVNEALVGRKAAGDEIEF